VTEIEASALKKVRNRLIPFVGLLYFAAFIDRVNVGFAAAAAGVIAGLIGHDSGAEHGETAVARALEA
jgi:ACS family tartrate transporter-like MFS transporter